MNHYLNNLSYFQIGGRKILYGLEFNTTLTKLDIRMCKIAAEIELSIQELVHENGIGRKPVRKSPVNVEVTNITINPQTIMNMETVLAP